MTSELAFYCVSSAVYFPGAVALVNSLRLHGHSDPVYLCGAGLRDWQRELLEPEVTVVDGPADAPPYLLKTIAPTSHPARVMVLIDVDMVATRSLAPLAEVAARGRVVAVRDTIDRFVPEWGGLLDLGPLERRPYVSSGLVVLGGHAGAEVLALWHDRMQRVDYERSWFARDEEGYPFRFIDQDVLNAVLASRPAAELCVEPVEVAPHQPYRGLRIVDERTLEVAGREGSRPYVLHQYLAKPWLEPMYHGIYSRLLSRLWLEGDVAIPLAPERVPARMRRGPAALARRKLVDFADLARWWTRDVIPERIAARRGRDPGEVRPR